MKRGSTISKTEKKKSYKTLANGQMRDFPEKFDQFYAKFSLELNVIEINRLFSTEKGFNKIE